MNKKSKQISAVIPLYNEAESLPELYLQLKDALSSHGIRYEIIFINDGSTDSSQQVLEMIAENDSNVKVIQFQKNYGKSAALSAGFKTARQDIVITIDADLQDDPFEIPNLIKKLEEGYDLVSGWKKKRRDPFLKKISSRVYNFITAKISGVHIHDINCGLKAYRREVVKQIHPYGEMHRYLPVLAHFAGFRVGEMIVKHHPRKYGKTKFGINRFTSGFFDLITVMFLNRYLRKPLHLFGIIGLLFFIAGFVINGYLTILWLSGEGIGRRPLFSLGILLLIIGVQFFSLGLLGEMMSESQKSRQNYIVRKSVGIPKSELEG